MTRRMRVVAFTLAGLLVVAAATLAAAGIWTGDTRWGETALLMVALVVIAVFVGFTP